MGRRARLHVPLAADYADDDKIIEAGEKAELLYVRGIAFTGRRGEREITHGQLLQVVGAGITDVGQAAQRLVDVGLWSLTARGYSTPQPARPRRPKIPAKVRQLVMARDGGRCVECNTDRDLSLDHIWPWSLGGDDNAENLRVLCRPCNSKKGARV